MPTDEKTLRLLTELDLKVTGLTERVELLETENASLKAENASLKAENAELKAENAELKAENAELKGLLHQQGSAKASKAPKFKENYSVEQNKGKPKSKRGKQSTGRRPHHIKLELVDEHRFVSS